MSKLAAISKFLKFIREGYTGTGNINDDTSVQDWKKIQDEIQLVLDVSTSDQDDIIAQFSDKDQIERIKKRINKEIISVFWSYFTPKFVIHYKTIWEGCDTTPDTLLLAAKTHFLNKKDKIYNITKQELFFAYKKNNDLSWVLTYEKLKTMAADIFPKFPIVKVDQGNTTIESHDASAYFVTMKMWQLIPQSIYPQLQLHGIVNDQLEIEGSMTIEILIKKLDLLSTSKGNIRLHKARSVTASNSVFISSCFSCGRKYHIEGEKCPEGNTICVHCNKNHISSKCKKCIQCGHSHLFPANECDVTPSYVVQYLAEKAERNRRTRQVQATQEVLEGNGVDCDEEFDQEQK